MSHRNASQAATKRVRFAIASAIAAPTTPSQRINGSVKTAVTKPSTVTVEASLPAPTPSKRFADHVANIFSDRGNNEKLHAECGVEIG